MENPHFWATVMCKCFESDSAQPYGEKLITKNTFGGRSNTYWDLFFEKEELKKTLF